MEQNKDTHWRRIMNTAFLNGDELPENGFIVEIVGYEEESFFSQKSRKQEEKVVLLFKGVKKPMIMTNRKAKQIAKVLGTPQMSEWVGKTVHIFPKEEKHFGEFFPVINIKSAKSVPKPSLNKGDANWEKACNALKEGKTSIDAIKKHYKITKVVEKELLTFKLIKQ